MRAEVVTDNDLTFFVMTRDGTILFKGRNFFSKQANVNMIKNDGGKGYTKILIPLSKYIQFCQYSNAKLEKKWR